IITTRMVQSGMKSEIKIDSSVLISLVDSALSADYTSIRRKINELARACLEQGDEAAAKRLTSLSRRKGLPLQTSGVHEMLPVDGASRLPLIDEEPWPTKPVVLNEQVRGTV